MTSKGEKRFPQPKALWEILFKMALFCCLRSTNGDIKINKIGFTFLGFFFSFIWAFSNKIYHYASISFIIFMLCYLLFLNNILNAHLLLLACFLKSFFWGFFGNNVLICKLINNGYNPEKLITTNNSKQALMIFLSQND